MINLPFSPFLAFPPIVKSITYARSIAQWGTNPPPATNFKPFRLRCFRGFLIAGELTLTPKELDDDQYRRSLMNCHTPPQHIYLCGRGRNPLPVLDERAALQLCHSLSQFLLSVHDDRTVPRHRLLNGLARYQQKTDAFFASLYRNLVAAIEEHE